MKRIIHCLKTILYRLSLYLLNRIITYIPFNLFRKTCYRILKMKIGRKTQIDMGQYVLSPQRIKIGNNSHINQGCLLDGRGGITIGDSVSISHRVQIITGSHDIQSKDFRGFVEPVELGDFVFIGVGSTILGGTIVGKGAVICAGAVVTKNVPEYSVVAGVPAKIITRRNPDLDYICKPDRLFM